MLRAIDIDNFNFLTNKMLVDFYIDTKNFDKAIICCDLMISKEIEKNFFITQKIVSQIHIGNWVGLKENLMIFNHFIDEDNSAINPLALKYINDDPLFQKNSLKNFGNNYLKMNIYIKFHLAI